MNRRASVCEIRRMPVSTKRDEKDVGEVTGNNSANREGKKEPGSRNIWGTVHTVGRTREFVWSVGGDVISKKPQRLNYRDSIF